MVTFEQKVEMYQKMIEGRIKLVKILTDIKKLIRQLIVKRIKSNEIYKLVGQKITCK